MRRIGIALILIALIGCGKDRLASMGNKAPVFGSTPELSTIQGFAVGKWRETIDPTVKAKKNLLDKLGDKVFANILTLSRDGKATMTTPKQSQCVGHGTWAVAGNQIAVSFTDVDGLSFNEIKIQLEKRWQKNDRLHRLASDTRLPNNDMVGRDEGIEGDRDFIATICNKFGNLVIGADGMHLESSYYSDPERSSQKDKTIWVRVSR